MMNVNELSKAIKERVPSISVDYADKLAQRLVEGTDEKLVPNLTEWMEGKEISDIYIGDYCVNSVMAIRGDHDFLNALEALNLYVKDKDAGVKAIWRGKK